MVIIGNDADRLVNNMHAWGEDLSTEFSRVLDDIDDPEKYEILRNLPYDIKDDLRSTAAICKVASMLISSLTASASADLVPVALAGKSVETFAGFIHFILSQVDLDRTE